MKNTAKLLTLLSIAFMVSACGGTNPSSGGNLSENSDLPESSTTSGGNDSPESSQPAPSSQAPSTPAPSSQTPSTPAPSSQTPSSQAPQSSNNPWGGGGGFSWGGGGGFSWGGGGTSVAAPTAGDGKINISGYGTTKFEAEKLVASDWVSDASYNGEVLIGNRQASGSGYLAAGAANSKGKVTFEFTLAKYSRVIFSAAYAQMQSALNEVIDLSKTYFYNIENVSPFVTTKTLAARRSATTFEEIEYDEQVLAAGTYKVTLTVLDNTPGTCPAIDYIQFATSDPNAASPADISKLTEADIPDNDFHNLQQYKYLQSSDWTTFKTYANGSDLSAPRGMKLKFDDVADAAKYYVQVSEKASDWSNAPVAETTTKYYMYQNAKLATKYYYRAANSQAGLAGAPVKEITSTDVAPRVINCPNVLNFRDIGGWESSLVKGAKINQGLYFRCAQLNQAGASSTRSELDSAGKGKQVIKDLGIKVDIDMRDSNNVPATSPANSNEWPVKLVKASIASGTESTRWEAFGDVYKLIFETIANSDKEPVALHCTYGADRTGIATFFLEALIGMSIDDIKMDYVWTKFTQGRDPNPDGELSQWIKKTQETYPTETSFANQMRAHLMTKGLSKATLEHIREIFVPGYVAEA